MRFIGFLLRVVGCLILAAGIAFAVGDIARSLGSEAVRMMPLREAALLSGLGTGEGAGAVAFGGAAAPLWELLASQPASVVCGVVGLLLLLLGRPRRRIGMRRAALPS